MKHALLLTALLLSAGDSFASLVFSVKQVGASEYEKPWLKISPDIKRDGPRLRIKTSSGTVVFEDVVSSGDDSTENSLVGAYPINQSRTDSLILTRYYEGYSFTLINSGTGAQIKIHGEPVLSNDTSHYLTYSCNEAESGGTPNEVVIIKTEDYSIEYTIEFDPLVCPISATWISEDEIFVLKQAGTRPEPITIKLRDGKWEQKALQ